MGLIPRGQARSLFRSPRFSSSDGHVNKSDLVHSIASELRTSKLAANHVLNAVLGSIQKGLHEEGTVTITGFGTFEVKERKSRVGRNPHTGEPIRIEAGRRVGFRVGKGLKQRI